MPQPVESLVERLNEGRGGALLAAGDSQALSDAAVAIQAASGPTTLRCQGYEDERSLRFSALADLLRPLTSDLALDDADAGPFALGRTAAELMRKAAQTKPVLAIVQEAHWLDPESAVAIAVAVQRTADAPVGWLIGLPDTRLGPFGTLRAETLDAETEPETGPDALAALPGGTLSALLVLAASGTGHVDEVGGALTGLGLHVGDLAPALAASLVAPTATGWRFQVPSLAERIYGSAAAHDRRRAHAALAAALLDLRTTESGELLAGHLAGAAASADARAATALGEAADGARLRGALEAARSAYLRAAGLSPDSTERATFLAGAADTARLLGDLGGVAQATREARRLTDDADLHRRLDRTAHRAAALRSVQPDLRTLLEPGTPYAACDLLLTGRSAEAAALLAPVVPAALLADPLDLGPLALPALAAASMWTGDGGGASDILDRSIALLTAYGALEHLPALLIVRAELAFRLGRWPIAEDSAEQAAALAERLGQQPVRAVARGLALRVKALMGRDTATATALEAESLGAEAYALWSRHAVGTAHAAARRWREAAVALADVEDGLERLNVREPSVLPVAGDLVEAALRIGELARARRTAQRAHELAQGSASTVARAVAERCLGQVGEVRSAKPCFEAALRLHAETGDRYEEARTLFAFARLETDKKAARRRFEQAADRFAAVGAWPWLAQAEDALAALRTAKPTADDVLAGLTAQELRVARLVVGGATNEEAAQALGISPRTVEQHLGVVYAKLHIRRRSELARFVT